MKNCKKKELSPEMEYLTNRVEYCKRHLRVNKHDPVLKDKWQSKLTAAETELKTLEAKDDE